MANIDVYTLSNTKGVSVELLNYGATIKKILVPDSAGKPGDIVLGFDTPEEYLQPGNPFFGCIAGRYANRIARGTFTLDGHEYKLPINNGKNTLHGGVNGFNKKYWKAVQQGNSVAFEYVSADGEEGFPGTLKSHVTYSLTDDNELRIDYYATTDKPTILNLTNHSYFNLSNGAATIEDHEITIAADKFVEANEEYIPTGVLKSVSNSEMDFRHGERIGKGLSKVKGGYDHTWVFTDGSTALKPVATVIEPSSGRVVNVSTTQPGMQFYTGNFLSGAVKGKGQRAYPKHGGLCLETQHFPDSPNQPSFPTTVLRPGEEFRQTTVYRFSVK